MATIWEQTVAIAPSPMVVIFMDMGALVVMEGVFIPREWAGRYV